MANKEHLKILNQGVDVWNDWRNLSSEKPDLSHADLSQYDLMGINFKDVNLQVSNLFQTDLSDSNLENARLNTSHLEFTNFENCNLKNAKLYYVTSHDAHFRNANLFKADLHEAELGGIDFSYANMQYANLENSDLRGAILNYTDLRYTNLQETKFINSKLRNADLRNADLRNAIIVNSDIENALLESAKIYGVSTWDLKGKAKSQKDLIITPENQPEITIDDIEVAQFIYLMLNNEKIRDVIGTIAQKGVLILGRFTPERKKILDAIREKLRQYDFVPMMFDFEKIDSRDYTETVKILAGMSRFVIVDVTHQSSCPLELQATVPDYKIPFIPLILKGERPFAMLIDLIRKYEWVSGVLEYENEEELIGKFQKEIIGEALTIEKDMKEKERKSYFRDGR